MITQLRDAYEPKSSCSFGDIFGVTGTYVYVCRSIRGTQSRPPESGRGEIIQFSKDSARRMRRYLRDSVAEYNVMGTLTYPLSSKDDIDGKKSKRDLASIIKRFRRRYLQSVATNSLFWFMEWTKNQVPHYHFFTNFRIDKKQLARDWYEVVDCGNPDHLKAGTRIESIKYGRDGYCSYAAKYAAKQHQKVIPEDFGWAGRFWGVVGLKTTVAASTRVTEDHMKIPQISCQVSKIHQKIYDCIEEGHGKSVYTGDRGIVVQLNRPIDVNIMRVRINDIEQTLRDCRQNGGIMPGLFERQ